MFKKDNFEKNGFIIIPKFYTISDQILQSADNLMNDYQYKIGRRHVCKSIGNLPIELKEIIYNKQILNFFNSLDKESILCKDVMITHEFKHDFMERNKWLHFDRWRSYKAMVYLTDVGEDDGPFCVVPKTHKKGAQLRRSSCQMRYEDRPNRIEIDYPELYQEPTKLIGCAGTLILFDSDVFHLGGKIKKGHERSVIRSHWYSNGFWRERS